MKFSFILPVYNAEGTLLDCVNSILNQTYKNIELIIIDDFSKDNSRSIIKEISDNDNRVISIFNSENIGTLCSRKKGVLMSSGDYILFADNDDIYDLKACEILNSELNSKKSDIIMYSVNPLNNDSIASSMYELNSLLEPIPEEFSGNNCMYVNNRISLLWNKAVNAAVCKMAYQNAEDLFLTIAEDRYASYLIHYYAKSFRTISNVLYYWNNTSGVSSKKTRNQEQFDKLCKCMYESSRAIEAFLTKNCETKALETFKSSDKGAGYCIDEWRKSIDSCNCVTSMNTIFDYYGNDFVIPLIYDKINYFDTEQKKYKSLFLDLCNSKLFRLYFYICKKFFKKYNDYVL